jgi:hypothetical protein
MSLSYFEQDPDGKSPKDEMEATDRKLKKWFNAFSDGLLICRGNHDRLVARKAKTSYLPSRVFKNFRDIWNLPKNWHDDFEWNIEGVKYIHGTGYSGAYGHISASYDNRCSVVMGHLHSGSGVEYVANNDSTVFAMATGCGIDRKAIAFAYGKEHKRKPVLSCGVVSYTRRGINAQIIPMQI